MAQTTLSLDPQKIVDYIVNNVMLDLGDVQNAMNKKENRRAKFVCAMTLVSPDGEIIFQTRGECHGNIAYKQAGTNGFGYDPIFLVGNGSTTMAELSEVEKNKISHRGQALRNVLEFLRNKS